MNGDIGSKPVQIGVDQVKSKIKLMSMGKDVDVYYVVTAREKW